MDEHDHPRGWDADADEPKPLTVDEANRVASHLKGEAHSRGSDLVLLAEAHRDAANRCATLEAENVQLRQLLGLRDVDATRALLDELERGARVVQGAVRALGDQVVDNTPRSDGQGQ